LGKGRERRRRREKKLLKTKTPRQPKTPLQSSSFFLSDDPLKQKQILETLKEKAAKEPERTMTTMD